MGPPGGIISQRVLDDRGDVRIHYRKWLAKRETEARTGGVKVDAGQGLQDLQIFRYRSTVVPLDCFGQRNQRLRFVVPESEQFDRLRYHPSVRPINDRRIGRSPVKGAVYLLYLGRMSSLE